MTERTRLQIYATEDLEAEIEKHAELADLSKSEYCVRVLKNHHHMDIGGGRAQYAPDEDIAATIDNAVTDLITAIDDLQTDATPDLEHLQSLRTMYVIALWELCKQEYSPAEREDAIKRAALQMGDTQGDTASSEDDGSTLQPSELAGLVSSDP
ncbi:hypothetical protein [Haloarcula sp. JP-L23]|uniref:hypothetical protein n=1 Tax=Haloarcula sp. JP-L23 TaxID=2716717 RepID=UPI00140EEF2E|nr:hypothetical protein G9465_23555 [Haloarcula sp. JP-L23]